MKKVLILFSVFFTFGCATKMDMTIISPAVNSDLTDYNNVAIWSIKSKELTEDYTELFEKAISDITLNNKKVIEVKKDKHVKEIREKISIPPDNPETIKKVAADLNVQGLWMGTISNEYNKESFKRTKNTCMDVKIGGPDERCGSILVFCQRDHVKTTLDIKLLDGETGIVFYDDSIVAEVTTEYCSDSKNKIMEKDIKEKAIDDVITKFTRIVAPYEENIKIELMSNKDGLFDDNSKSLFSTGIAFAKEGRIDKACNAWNIVYENNPKAVSIMYNKALCYEWEKKYDEALLLLESLDKMLAPANFSAKFYKFFKLRELPNNLVLNAIERNKKHIADRDALSMQINK